MDPPVLTSPRQIQRKQPSLAQYQTKPITKHYELNHQILSAFESNYESKIYGVAYALGLQFIETALLEIPKHGYFYSQRHERERMQSALDAVRVAQSLQDIQSANNVTVMDATRQRVQLLAELALDQVQKASEDQQENSTYESQRAATEKELKLMDGGDDDWVLCEPLLACSESWSSIINYCPSGQLTGHARNTSEGCLPPEAPMRPKLPPPPAADPIRVRMQTTPPRLTKSPAFPVAPTRPSLSERAPASLKNSFTSVDTEAALAETGGIRASNSFSDEQTLQKALFLSGLAVNLGEKREQPIHDNTDSSFRRSQRLELATVSTLYQEDFNTLIGAGRVRVSFASTYQGRLPESTNGCTVIAPLLCIHHLLEAEQLPDMGLTDATILQVIDFEAPAILAQLRKELGLSAQAFLIPSDAHDYLIENGQLCQEQFVDVVGGNILNDEHLQALVDALTQSTSTKLAATLFFHEHVIAILRVQRDRTSAWYDLIDSLPLQRFLMRDKESSIEFERRVGLQNHTDLPRDEHSSVPMAARIRCLDVEALVASLRWYACSKFTEENMNYIDQYDWSDENSSCDFDPRVFQAFIWREAPQ